MSLSLYVNGKFTMKKEEAVTSIFDHGFLYGDGIFEGIRFYNGVIFKCSAHIKRLYESARAIALTIPHSEEELTEILRKTVAGTGLRDGYIRLVVSRGEGDLGLNPKKCRGDGQVFIIADTIQLYPEEKYEKGLRVITTSIRRSRPDILNCRAKTLNYLNNILAVMEVNQAGVDEGIMLNDAGYVSEATADNIFVVKDGALKTTPPYMGILKGITRDTVIELARKRGFAVEEAAFLMHDVYTADEVFLTGSGAELIPVVEADSRMIADGKPGPIFRKLLTDFRELTQVDGLPIYAD